MSQSFFPVPVEAWIAWMIGLITPTDTISPEGRNAIIFVHEMNKISGKIKQYSCTCTDLQSGPRSTHLGFHVNIAAYFFHFCFFLFVESNLRLTIATFILYISLERHSFSCTSTHFHLYYHSLHTLATSHELTVRPRHWPLGLWRLWK